jgi:hypothetical protein
VSASILYDSSAEIALLTNTFQTGSPLADADPTAVTCLVTDPSGNAVLHTYQGASPSDITKPLVGHYVLTVPCSPNEANADGLWSYKWTGTGTVSDVQPGTWRVLSPALYALY